MRVSACIARQSNLSKIDSILLFWQPPTFASSREGQYTPPFEYIDHVKPLFHAHIIYLYVYTIITIPTVPTFEILYLRVLHVS